MKMTPLEIILSGCAAALFIILILVADTEEDYVTELEYNLSVAQTQLLLYKNMETHCTKLTGDLPEHLKD
jgi:hypothetical protein